MIRVPEHIQKLQPYKPGKTGTIDKELLSKQTILCSNENNFGVSPLAKLAIQRYLDQTFQYPDPTASELKEKLALKHHIQPFNLSISNGSDSILFNVMKAFMEPNEEIIMSESSFVSAAVMANISNLKILKIPMLPDFKYDLDGILAAINPHTKIIYLVNPNNPTGTLIYKDDLLHFIDKVPNHIVCVIDEAYFEFAQFLYPEFVEAYKLKKDNIITLRTLSKAYGLAGLRVGYAIANESLITPLNKVKLIFEPNVLAQKAAIGALDDTLFLQQTLENNSQELKVMENAYSELGLKWLKSFGNFICINFETSTTATNINNELLKRNIVVRKLDSFDLPQCLRITIGKPNENKMLIQALTEILDSH